MSSFSHEELMQLYDGELDPEREREILDSLDEEARGVLAGMDQVGDLLRELGERRGQAADGIAEAVMAELGREQAGPEVIAAREPVVVRPSRWRRAAPVVAGALALAAAVALVLRATTPHEPPPDQLERAVAPGSALPVPGPVAEPASDVDEAGPAVAIEAVDFGSHDGTIFMVSAGEEVTPVVWLSESAGGDRTEPL